jgi:hypothetical protein
MTNIPTEPTLVDVLAALDQLSEKVEATREGLVATQEGLKLTREELLTNQTRLESKIEDEVRRWDERFFQLSRDTLPLILLVLW